MSDSVGLSWDAYVVQVARSQDSISQLQPEKPIFELKRFSFTQSAHSVYYISNTLSILVFMRCWAHQRQ